MKRNLAIIALCITTALTAAACSKADSTAESVETTESTAASPESAESEDSSLAALDEDGNEAESDASDEYEFSKTPERKYGTIVSVDTENSTVNVLTKWTETEENGEVSEYEDEVIFHVPAGAPIVDASTGAVAVLSELKEGDEVYAWAGDTMTMSIPAQMTLQAMLVNIDSEKFEAKYAIANGIEWSKDDADLTIVDQDGVVWEANSVDTQIEPYLTKQIVRLEDVKKDSRMIIFPVADESGNVSETASTYQAAKIILMND